LLDLGCELGGPAPFQAAGLRMSVDEIALSQSFIEVARKFTERSGLADRLIFLPADGLELTFADAFFDPAWDPPRCRRRRPSARADGPVLRTRHPIDGREQGRELRSEIKPP
jgi:hypothetical protein